METQQLFVTFDLEIGRALRDQGMDAAADRKKDLLNLGRIYAKRAAEQRIMRTATADDVADAFEKAGLPPNILGNAMGSVFKGREWNWTGNWQQSNRVSNHARVIRVWRLSR